MSDIVLIALLGAGFLLGYFRGAVRQLLTLGAWLVAFLLAAHARPVAADWLAAQWREYSLPYVEMLAFGILFAALVAVGLALAQFTGGRITLTRHEWIDDILGGLLGMGIVALTTASVYVILATIYGGAAVVTEEDVGWLRELHAALGDSAIVNQLRQSLLPGLGSILSPLLPPDVRAVMG